LGFIAAMTVFHSCWQGCADFEARTCRYSSRTIQRHRRGVVKSFMHVVIIHLCDGHVGFGNRSVRDAWVNRVFSFGQSVLKGFFQAIRRSLVYEADWMSLNILRLRVILLFRPNIRNRFSRVVVIFHRAAALIGSIVSQCQIRIVVRRRTLPLRRMGFEKGCKDRTAFGRS
jgi:hypothetical protein